MDAILHEPLPRFIAQAIAIIVVARLVGLVARRISQPLVIAEIVAGILLGPSFLGWIAPGFSHALFPKESMAILQMVSQIGLILFMFLVGLELDPKLLRGRGHTSVVISHTSIIVPFVLGGILAIWLYPRVSDGHVPFSSFMLFMGAAMSITAFPVLARILAERRLTHTKVGAVTITCAAVDDVTAWCILAFVVAIARSGNIAAAVRTTGFALVYIGIMFFGVRPFLARFGARVANREGLTQNVVAVTLVLLLLSSWATELIGIHALFGAFAFGAVMPKEGGFAKTLAEKLEDLVLIFMLPLFFAYSGLRTQILLLDSPRAWAMCGLVILVACVGKFGGAAVAARITGLRWREASALGILMNTRGLVELVALNIGLDLGVISPMLFTMMVIMALVTTFITTPLLQLVYPQAELARELDEPVPAAAVAVAAAGGSITPVPAAGHGFGVLMCVSYDRSGPALVTLAAALVDRGAREDRLYALRLIPPTDRGSFYIAPDGQQRAEGVGVLAPLLKKAEELEVTVKPLSFVSPDPSHDICNVAAVKGVDLVLMGWHKPLLSQTVLGGTVYTVMKNAHADVGVLVDRGVEKIKRVLVPFYGGRHDTAALGLAQRLVHQTGAEATILHVVPPGRRLEAPLDARGNVERVFEEDAERNLHVNLKIVERDSPAAAALEESALGYDLVIVGIGPEWGLEERQFGLQPEYFIRGCATSILIVRKWDGAAAAAEATRAAGGPAGAEAAAAAEAVPAVPGRRSGAR